MKFNDLDSRMRIFETNSDLSALPGIYMVARIDGHGFTRLTKEIHKFEAPYDIRFRDHMIATVEHLMNCGVRIIYGYTQSDEISLLFHRDEGAFGRKLRKYNSIFAGEASACFTLRLGAIASFDCRICQLPGEDTVVDYFRWRQEDAARNSLHSHCYWLLRKQGKSVKEATERLTGKSTADKNELLYKHGINFNRLPSWQKRGIGLYWETVERDGLNPKTGKATKALRRQLKVDTELKMKKDYEIFISGLLENADSPGNKPIQ